MNREEIPFEEALEQAEFFLKNATDCTEYEDAWMFFNRKRKPGVYNPVVIMKNGEEVPASIYQRTSIVRSIPKTMLRKK